MNSLRSPVPSNSDHCSRNNPFRLNKAEGKVDEAERALQRVSDQLTEKTKQFDGLKAQFDPLFEEVSDLKKTLHAKKGEAKVRNRLPHSLLYRSYRLFASFFLSEKLFI